MKLNRYVVKVDYDEDNLILYNTINRSVILLNKKEFSQPNENVIKTLANYKFLSTNSNCLQLLYSKLNESFNETRIVIELCESCNFHCAYCYQYNWAKKHILSNSNIQHLINYLDNFFSKINLSQIKQKLIIEYFG